MSLALFFAAQHVSNASTFICRSLRLCVGILLWFDVCWRYSVVRLGWCGIFMQAEALFNCQDDARSNKHKIHVSCILGFNLLACPKFFFPVYQSVFLLKKKKSRDRL